MKEGNAFIHVEKNLYYSIEPRYPFVYVTEHLQAIPQAHVIGRSQTDVFDLIIVILFLLLAIFGLCIGLYRLRYFDICRQLLISCFYKRNHKNDQLTVLLNEDNAYYKYISHHLQDIKVFIGFGQGGGHVNNMNINKIRTNSFDFDEENEILSNRYISMINFKK